MNNIIKLEKLNNEIVIKKMENGLTVIFCKTPAYNTNIAVFGTKYGAKNNDFIPIQESKMTNFPLGVAHFLEHKLFESQEEDIFKLFSNNNAGVNAWTSKEETRYYFVGTNYFFENLEILLNFVQEPHFTDKNVEKEKGIISQEIDMCLDDYNRVLYETLYKNSLVEAGERHSIIGTKETIGKITKEDLYRCYNTFYHPSNMYLIISGDLEEDTVFKLIEENQKRKTFKKQDVIIEKEVVEPEKVYKVKEEIYENIVKSKAGICYKVKFKKDLSNINEYMKKQIYIEIYLSSIFGPLSDFSKELIDKKIIYSHVIYYVDFLDDYALIFVRADVQNFKSFEDEIDKKINCKVIEEEIFNTEEKNQKAIFIKLFESPIGISSVLESLNNSFGIINKDMLTVTNNLNYNEMIHLIKDIDFSNKTKVLLKPIKKE